MNAFDVSFQTTPTAYVKTYVNGDTPASREEACADFKGSLEEWYKDSILLAAINMDLGEYSDREVKLISDETSVYSADDYYDILWDIEAPSYILTPFGELFGGEAFLVEEQPVRVFPYEYYFYDKTGKLLAETWGSGENYAVDVDGDGEHELISNLVYGDGGQEGVIFKREGDEIYEGDLFDLMDEEYVNLSYASQSARYLPKEDAVEISYTVQQGAEYESKTKKYKIDLNKITFYKAK